jgi:endonuclease/exonuclease/phosphatase family metal-dependent hydrolase
MSKPLRALVTGVGLLALGLGGLVAAVFATEHRPGELEPAPTACTGDGRPLRAGEPFTVVSWNLQYGASREHRFFYDGGEAVHVPADDVAWTVGEVSRYLRESGAAVHLLQEIDRDSDRTGRIDQLPAYVEAAGAACATAAPYHLSPFVPKPFANPLGRVHMALGVLSAGPHARGMRQQLALMDEPRLVQAFNLKRALLTVELPVEGHDQPLAVAVTHLSAFSYGDGTMAQQVAALARWMEARPPGQPWILAGDLNLLPPGDDKARLTVEQELYADAENPVETLIPRFQELFSDRLLDPAVRTYLPFGAEEPDRKIDYFFYGGPLTVLEADVPRSVSTVSDHLPIRARLVVGAPPAPAPPPTEPPPAEPPAAVPG